MTIDIFDLIGGGNSQKNLSMNTKFHYWLSANLKLTELLNIYSLH